MDSANRSVELYFRNSMEILEASRNLAEALDSSAIPSLRDAEIDSTVESLKAAVARTSEKPHLRSGFSADKNPIAADELTIDQTLTVAATDAMLAQVLFAASEAVGERSDPMGIRPLRAALNEVDLPQINPPGINSQRFSPLASGSPSVDREHAIDTFRKQADSSLDKLLDVSVKAVENILSSLAATKDRLLEGFAEISNLFEIDPGATALLRSGWEKLKSALEALRKLIDLAPAEAIDSLDELVKSKSVHKTLARIYTSDNLKIQIAKVQPRTGLQSKDIDARSRRFEALEVHFEKLVANIRRVAAVVGLLGSVIAAHVTGPFGVLAVPASYALAIAAIVLLGADFARYGRWNEGIGIAQSVDEIR